VKHTVIALIRFSSFRYFWRSSETFARGHVVEPLLLRLEVSSSS